MTQKKTQSDRHALAMILESHTCPPPDHNLSAEGRAEQGLRTALLDLMRLTSEEEWVMGWAPDLEFKLWLCAEGRWDYLEWKRAAGLHELSNLTGGWWAWSETDHRPTFLPLEEWFPTFAAWEAEDRQEPWWGKVRPATPST